MTELDELVARLDLRSKVRLLTGSAMFTLHGEPGIGLQPISLSDGPTGVRGLTFTGTPITCLLPNATLLASSWREEVAAEVGALLAGEAARQEIHVVLGPTINLHRSPLGGRLFEAYSEDPLLTGRFAASYVRGLQQAGIGACLKHLVANEAETDRHGVNSVVDTRTLREVYLLPFEIAVEDATPWSIMAAYNNVNGVPATEQDEINNDILKGEWGWDGLVMSDWFATTSTAASANGGLDLVMPGPDGPWGEALVSAVEAGEVPERVVDDHVRRLLRLAARVGALGEARSWPAVPAPDSEQRREQLVRLAAEGMTVLRNEQGTLPLAAGTSIALVGRHAVETTCMGGGSAQVRSPYEVSIADGLVSRMGADVTVCDGVRVRSRVRPARPGSLVDPVSGEPGIRVRRYDSSGALVSETREEQNLSTFGVDDPPGQVARVEVRALVPAGAQTVGVVGVGRWALRLGDLEHVVTCATETGDLGEALLQPPGWTTDVVLADTTELVAELTLSAEQPFGAVGLAASRTPPSDDHALEAAAQTAAAADVAVVVVGLTEEQETEAVDKTTLRLPGRQDDLVRVVAAAAPRTVVVVNSATPVLMPWRDEVDAILWAGLPGQEAGHAVAAALLNDIEPAGRMVTSIPDSDGASPAWNVTPTDGELRYTEGPFLGYRGFAAGTAPAPAYWFGHGLGYGSFRYGEVEVDDHRVTVEVTNDSDIDSREVVQVYWDPCAPSHPVRLVGWADVLVPAGGTVVATVECDQRMWRTWNEGAGAWQVLSGGEMIVARGLGDVRHRCAVT